MGKVRVVRTGMVAKSLQSYSGPCLVCSDTAGLVLDFLTDVRKFVNVRKSACAYYRRRRREKHRHESDMQLFYLLRVYLQRVQ